MKKIILLGAALFAGLSFGQVKSFTFGPLIPFGEEASECANFQGYANSDSSATGTSYTDRDVTFRTVDTGETEFKFYVRYQYLEVGADGTGIATKNFNNDNNPGVGLPGTDRIANLLSLTDGADATLEIMSYTSSNWVGLEADGFNPDYTGACNVAGFSAGKNYKVYVKATLNAPLATTSEAAHLDLGTVSVNSYIDNTGATATATNFAFEAHYSTDLNTALSTNKLEAFNFSFNNPVNNRLDLRADNTISSVELYNVMGQKALSVKLNATNGSLDLSSLSRGVYVMKATVDNKVGTFRVLKK